MAILFKDNFNRSNSSDLGAPDIGGLWQEFNQVTSGSSNFASTEIDNGTLAFELTRTILGNDSWYLPALSAPLVQPATSFPVTIEFDFTPTQDARTDYFVGLMSSQGLQVPAGFGNGATPYDGIAIEFGRSSAFFGNSEVNFAYFSGGNGVSLPNVLLPFQLDWNITYHFSLTVGADGSASVTVTNNADASQTFTTTASIPPASVQLTQFFISDLTAFSSATPGLVTQAAHFDNIQVADISVANHAPDASNIAASANENTNILPVILNAIYTDPDAGDTFTFSADTTGTIGKVIDNGDGTFTYDPNGKLESLSVGDTATDTFTYTVTDSQGGSSAATATITIHGENDTPTASADAAVVQKGKTTLSDASHGVLANDHDVDNDVLRVSAVNGLDFNVGQSINGAYGTLTLNSDGSYSYVANKNIPGITNKGGVQDQFAYTVDDGHGGTATSTLTVTVQTAQALSKAPVLSINPLDANRDEGNSGTTPFTFVVTRDGNASGVTTVDWTVGATTGVTADSGDFAGGVFPTGTVTFNAGEFSKTITVNVQGDMLYESNSKTEKFVVTLSDPSEGATISPADASAVGKINNDDAAPVKLKENSVVVEMAQLAADAYFDVTAPVRRGWQPLSAGELQIDGSASEIGAAGGVLYRFTNGLYEGSNASTPGLADALVLKGNVDGKWTLMIAFRGTDEPDDIYDYLDFNLHYEKFKPLIEAVKDYVRDTNNGVEQVLLAGHSLGGSMVQMLLDEQFDNIQNNNMHGFTWASPGAEVTPANNNLTNFLHKNDAVPVYGSLADYHLAGNVVEIDTLGSIDSWVLEPFLGFPQHLVTTYVSDTKWLVREAFAEGVNPFGDSAIGQWLQNGLMEVIEPFDEQIVLGTKGQDSISISSTNTFVLGSEGKDSFVWHASLLPVGPFLPESPIIIDGGAGDDTLLLAGQAWSWQISEADAEQTDLFYQSVKVAELFRIEHLLTFDL